MYCKKMAELFDRWAAAAYDKVELMARSLGGWRWTCDRGLGTITENDGAGGPFSTAAQFLGRESECGKRWTWAWAYAPGTVAEGSLDAARRLRDYGRREELLAFIVPSFDLEGNCGHQLAMIATGLLAADFYVECETEEGSLYFLKERHPVERREDPVDRIFRLFPRLIDRPDCRISDQKLAFRSYLEFYGFEVDEMPDKRGWVVLGRDPGNRRLLIGGFDREGRAVGLAEAREPRRAGRRTFAARRV